MVERMANFTNKYGLPSDTPYFSLDGSSNVTADKWDSLRYTWNHVHGLTNIWHENSLHGSERVKGGGFKSAPRSAAKTNNSAMHLNQKPLEFMRRLITSTTNAGDIVWEPFGGLASASVSAIELNRFPCVAEINPNFQKAALNRLNEIIQRRKYRLTLFA